MAELTKRQRQVLDFIQFQQRTGETAPTLREIAAHFGFKSSRAAADHLDALKRKGVLQSEKRKARSLRVISPLQTFVVIFKDLTEETVFPFLKMTVLRVYTISPNVILDDLFGH